MVTSDAAAVSKMHLDRLQPQWHAGQITDKSDMYAFGVVVLEMMTGMQAMDARRPQGCETLPQLLQPALQAVQLMQVCQLATLSQLPTKGNNSDVAHKLREAHSEVNLPFALSSDEVPGWEGGPQPL